MSGLSLSISLNGRELPTRVIKTVQEQRLF